MFDRREYNKRYHEENKEALNKGAREYYLSNKEALNKRSREYFLNNKERLKLYNKKYRLEHQAQMSERNKIWRRQNAERLDKKSKEYYKTGAGRYFRLRNDAKRRATKFSLGKEEFIDWFDRQDKKCYYCGVEVNMGSWSSRNQRRRLLTFDRKDNSKGYSLENIVICCWRCNGIKSDYISAGLMLEIGSLIAKEEDRT